MGRDILIKQINNFQESWAAHMGLKTPGPLSLRTGLQTVLENIERIREGKLIKLNPVMLSSFPGLSSPKGNVESYRAEFRLALRLIENSYVEICKEKYGVDSELLYTKEQRERIHQQDYI